MTDDIAVTTITRSELLAGVRRLTDGQRKTRLDDQIDRALRPYRDTGTILAFEEQAADRYADVLVASERADAPISTADALIAAICLAHEATYATRNTRDFAHTGVAVIDP